MEMHKIKFWGIRGSNPTTNTKKLGVGGETSCVEIRTASNDLIILDMGTGIRNLGKELLQEENPPRNINIFISHYHWDHILGFLSFAPLYNDKFNFIIHGKSNSKGNVENTFNDILDFRFWPVSRDMFSANISFKEISPGTIQLNDEITVENNIHPHPGGAHGFRVELGEKVITYITDIEHPPGQPLKDVIHLSRNSDLLIHEAHFTPEELPNYKGWGHSSWEEAVGVAKSADVKQLALYHYSPTYDDQAVEEIEKAAKHKFPQAFAAREGMTVNLPKI